MRQFCHICKKQMELLSDPETGVMKCIFCGTTLFTPSYAKLEVGTIINGFFIESKLGQGGMGVVYKAKQMNLERYVALKVLAEHLADDREFVERFFKEARAAANLNHANIVQVYDAGSTLDGIYYFAMELIEGETLETRLMRDGLIPPKDAVDVVVKIAHALEYAWERQKLTHGDIKPDNIILNTSGGVKLADLGLAKFVYDEKSLRDGGIMATPLYAPPEIISGDFSKISYQADIYSFGATFYHMLVGVPPFNAEDPEVVLRKHLTEKHVPVKVKNREISSTISDLIDKMLAKKTEDRPESWSEIVSSLEKIKDFERKIFHIPHVADKQPAVPSKELQEDDNKIYRVISVLLVVLFFLSVFTVVIILRNSKSSNNPAPQKSESREQSAIASKEWQILKSKLDTISTQEGLLLLEKFISKNQDYLPDDVSASYELLRKKNIKDIESKQTATKIKERLSAQFDEILADSSSDSLEKKTFAELQFLMKRIESILSLSSAGKYNLQVPEDKRQKLNVLYMQLSGMLEKLRNQEMEVYQKQLEESRLKRIEEQKIWAEKKREERNLKLAVNMALDEYYCCLAESKSPTEINLALEKLLKKHENKLPQRFKDETAFIRTNYIDAPDALMKQMSQIEDTLKNKTLPISSVSREYSIEELTDKGIKLQMTINKVKIGKVVQWELLSAEDSRELIEKLLFANNAYKPNVSDISSFASYLLTNRLFDQLSLFLDRFSVASAPKKSAWIQFLNDMKKAQEELEAIKKMSLIRDAYEKNDILRTSEFLVTFLLNHSASETALRYSEEIAIIKQESSPFNHMISVLELINAASQLMSQKKYSEALQRIYCAKVRFNADGDNLKLKEKLAEMEKTAITELPLPKGLSKTFAPFYEWDTEKLEESLKFISSMNDNLGFKKAIDKNPAIGTAMSLAAKLSMGDWEEQSSFNENMPAEIMRMQGPISYVIPSLLFASAIYSDRLSPDAELSVRFPFFFSKMIEKFSNSPVGLALSTSLATEYAIANGRFTVALDILANYKMSPDDTNDIRLQADAKIFMLNFYASLNKVETASTIVQKFHDEVKRFSAIKALEGDMMWMNDAVEIISGKQLPEDAYAKLAASRPLNMDICSRIMLSCLSNRALYGNPSWNAKRISQIIFSKMKGGTAQSQTFRNLSYFRLAMNAYSYDAFNMEVNKLLLEASVPAIPSYPAFSMLSLASSLRVGKITANDIAKLLQARLKESSCASPFEINAVSMSNDKKKSLEFLSTISSKGLIAQAFDIGIFFYLLADDDIEAKTAIKNELLNNETFLNTEQRYLLNSLKDTPKRQ